jgi:phosphatidate cytidylyltransferase
MMVADSRARWRDLAPRVASALVMAPLGLASIWAGGLVWQIVLTALSMVAMLEWASLCGARPMTRLAQAAAAALAVGFLCHAILASCPTSLFPQEISPHLAATASAFTVVALAAFWILPSSRMVSLGMAYVGFGWASLLVLRDGAGGFGQILFIMVVVWANDIGAYLAGRLIGGPRLAPTVSPGKTWAGAAGGFATAVAAGLAVVSVLHAPHPGLVDAAWQAAILAIVAQAGDLLESAMKRHYGKKDSGSLIPGHGGLLDRVDGLLGAATAAMLLRLVSIVFLGVDAWS